MKKVIIFIFFTFLLFILKTNAQKTYEINVLHLELSLENSISYDYDYFDSINIAKYKVILLKTENHYFGKIKHRNKSTKGPITIVITEKERLKYKWIKISSNKFNHLLIPIEKLKSNEINHLILKKFEKEIIVAKPAIYIYPNNDSLVVHIKHYFKGTVLNTYPDYDTGWKVKAFKDGKLFNYADNRNYEYLFWDGSYTFPSKHYQYPSGFYLSKSEIVDFLMKQLSSLQFNEKEINDFIVFWLPIMSQNEHMFVHFWVNDNIDNSSVLSIDPQPDQLIRVYMEVMPCKASDIGRLPVQHLPKINRKGFTVLEWGGAMVAPEIIHN